MAEIVFLLFFIVPAMLGLAEIFHFIKLKIMCPAQKATAYKIIILDDKEFSQQIIFEAEKWHWQRRGNEENVIAINSFVTEKNIELCEATAKMYNMVLCSFDELSEIIIGRDYIDG